MATTIYPANRGVADSTSRSDKDLLKRIRDRFNYMVVAWKNIREDAALSMQVLSRLGAWEPAERKRRKELKRPCLHFDQLNQYVNNLINEIRLNPLAIKVSPAGEGSDERTARLLADRIRQLEYESDATDAYRTAFENAVQRGYGVFSVITEYESWDSDNLRIKVRRFANPDVVFWDPDTKEADCSDMQDAITLDRIRKADFEREYPDAQITSFGDELTGMYPQWFDKDSVQVAAYWYIEKDTRTRYLLDDGSPTGIQIYRDELDKGYRVNGGFLTFANGQRFRIVKKRDVEKPTVKQVVTNGIEILDRADIPGTTIPIFPVLGREKYICRQGGTSKNVERVLESYIWQGIDAQQLFDYYKTTEAEVVKMTPKTPYIAYEGQLINHDDEWERISDEPLNVLQVKPVLDATGQAVLPIPQRQPYEPAIQSLEVGAEAARRAIQSALGSYGFTRLDDTNVKSGKAINALDKQSDMGSFHFIDNLKSTLKRAGRYYCEILPIIEDTPRSVGIRNQEGEHSLVRINETMPDGGQNVYGLTANAQHEVTVSTGPSYQSTREAAKEFAGNLAQQPEMMARIGDLLIKLQDLGPIGDEIAKRIKPPGVDGEDGIPPEIKQQVAQMQQQYEAALEDAMKQLEELKKVIETKQIETQGKVQIETAKVQADQQLKMIDAQIEQAKLQLEWNIAQLKAQTDKALTHEKLTTQENIADEKMDSEEKIARIQATHRYNSETDSLDET